MKKNIRSHNARSIAHCKHANHREGGSGSAFVGFVLGTLTTAAAFLWMIKDNPSARQRAERTAEDTVTSAQRKAEDAGRDAQRLWDDATGGNK